MLSGSGGCADASARPLRLTAACELGRGAAGGWHSASSPNPKPSWVQKGEGARRWGGVGAVTQRSVGLGRVEGRGSAEVGSLSHSSPGNILGLWDTLGQALSLEAARRGV